MHHFKRYVLNTPPLVLQVQHSLLNTMPFITPSLPTRTRPVHSRSLYMCAQRPVVPILMGSKSDLAFCERIANALDALDVPNELRIASAHKVPQRLMQIVSEYEADPRPKLYVAVAGRSNALSGMLDCAVSAPVISCPPYSDAFGGADLFSSIRMPSGVAPALVLDPANAALFAAKILAVYDDDIRDKVQKLQKDNRDRLRVDDVQVLTNAYLPMIAKLRLSGDAMVSTDTNMLFAYNDELMRTCKPTATKTGKVRDQYTFTASVDRNVQPSKMLAMVTTDRQSAFDRVLAAIPYKGAVLNLVSAWWFDRTKHIVPNHVLAVPHPNVTIARPCKPFPVEFVVRAYITGSTDTSLWKNYQKGVRNYCGIQFPDGLRKNQKLPQIVLTPTTKEELGDRPISPQQIIDEGLMSQRDWQACADAALALFKFGQQVASQNGLILVDTKYEFGKDDDGTIRLIDEIHTPDSSRYWLSTSYQSRLAKGEEPESIDKEFLRLWFVDNCDPYDKSKQLPDAPAHLVDELSRRYIMLYELITGSSFDLEGAAQGPRSIAEAMAKFASIDVPVTAA